jgi:hypothetical protein
MEIVFTFIDGPMQGIVFSGRVDDSNEASSLYHITDSGTVGREFTTLSSRGRRAIAEMESSGETEFGGPYEYYLYRVVERSDGDHQVHVRASLVNRMPFGFHPPGSLH